MRDASSKVSGLSGVASSQLCFPEHYRPQRLGEIRSWGHLPSALDKGTTAILALFPLYPPSSPCPLYPLYYILYTISSIISSILYPLLYPLYYILYTISSIIASILYPLLYPLYYILYTISSINSTFNQSPLRQGPGSAPFFV